MSVIWELVGKRKVCLQGPSTTFEKQCIWVVENVFRKAAAQEGLHPTRSIWPRGVCSPGCCLHLALWSWLCGSSSIPPGLQCVTSRLLLPASTSAIGGAAKLWPGMTFFPSHFLGVPYHHLGLPRIILTFPELFFTFIYLLLVIIYYYYIYYLEVRVGSTYSTTYGSWFSSTMWV